MSTDFFINKEQMENAGLIEFIRPYTQEYEHDNGEVSVTKGTEVKFTFYSYLRDCAVIEENAPNTLNISCSGSFRSLLHENLKHHNINYEYF